ncbi:hypothetical protein SNEBB_003016 [Seison nebaliae]|nr:hypothetical protein SNEBB_003016 [Seison nebaliae]
MSTIPVQKKPSQYACGDSSPADMEEQIHVKMREFEEECDRWRHDFFQRRQIKDNELPSDRVSSEHVRPSYKSFVKEQNGRKRYFVQFFVGDFTRDELSVKVNGRNLTIDGLREISKVSAVECKKFNREITLPKFADIDNISSLLSNNGLLSIETPIFDDIYENETQQLSDFVPHCKVESEESRNRGQYERYHHPINIAPDSKHKNDENEIDYRSRDRDVSNAYWEQTGESGERILKYRFNLQGFEPNDINIQILCKKLKVKAIREEKNQDGTTKREFKREITLPSNADVRNLNNILTKEGYLLIDIPFIEEEQLPHRKSQSGTQTYRTNQNITSNISEENNERSDDEDNDDREVISRPVVRSNTKNEIMDVNNKELKLTLDLSDYKPKDVSVKVTNSILKVHARHESTNLSKNIHRDYTRQFALPAWVDLETIRAEMSKDGLLAITFELPQVTPDKHDQNANVPVEQLY